MKLFPDCTVLKSKTVRVGGNDVKRADPRIGSLRRFVGNVVIKAWTLAEILAVCLSAYPLPLV